MIPFKHPTLKSLLLAATMLASPVMLTVPQPAAAQLAISVQIEPPVLPVYEQPPIPEPGYIWTPGYWAYDNDEGYYWVPGTWVQPPEVNVLWTPPYWGWADGAYVFHDGYWGPHVGFYGGIDYGFGYGGEGYEGGRWDGGHFAYNRTVNNFGGVQITNVYESKVTVINNTHVSYVGGTGGVRAQPTPAQIAAEHEHHVQATAEQTRHFSEAAKNPQLAAKLNGGHPAIAATARPAQFQGAGVVPGRAPEPAAGSSGCGAGATPHPVPGHEPPAPHPEEHAAPAHEPLAPHPEEHGVPVHEPPMPHPVERPAPAAHEPPAPHPEEHAAPAHEPPAPHPAERPTPAARPAPPPAEHAAPPPAAPHPAPPKAAPKEEEKKPEPH